MRRLVQVLVSLRRRPLRAYIFDKPTITIGRDPGSDILIENPAISRTHARVHIAPEAVSLQDLGSPNGTSVNGETIHAAQLTSDDVISVGKFELLVRLDVDGANPGDPLPEPYFKELSGAGSRPTMNRIDGFSDIPEPTVVTAIEPLPSSNTNKK